MEDVIGIRRRDHVVRLTFASGGERLLPAAMEREWPVSHGPFDSKLWDALLEEKAEVYALRELTALESRRDHTRAELMRTLEKYAYPRDAAERALDRMESAGLVSDERYCGSLIRRKQQTCGRGKLRLEMRRKGVDAQTADLALDAFSEEEELQAAQAYAQKLFARGAAREKVFRSLLSRGYSRGVCLKAVHLAEEDTLED